MENPSKDLIQFLARYSPYTVLPGFWFAYSGEFQLWIGGISGFGAALMLAIPAMIAKRRKNPRKNVVERDRLKELLEG